MSYINRKQTEDAIRKYADQKHSNGEQIEYINGILKAISVINEQPAADVKEVKHGYWITDEKGIVICSECGEEHAWDEYRATYCEDCGAKMDGGKK